MSRDNLGNKQTIFLHNCWIKDARYELVYTPHKQKLGDISSKKQTKRSFLFKTKLQSPNFAENEMLFRNLTQLP